MAPRWDQIILPVGREQDRINAGVVRTRGNTQVRPIGIVAVHRKPGAIEVANRRLEDDKVHASSGPGAIVVSSRIRGVVEWIVHRIEIAARGDGDPSRVDLAVISGRRSGLADNRLHTPAMPVGMVLVNILSDVGLIQFGWWVHRERAWSG